VEPKLLLQKAMNRVMYSRCATKAGRRQPFRASLAGLCPGGGSAAGALREAMDVAAAAGLHYHREALAAFAAQFAAQLGAAGDPAAELPEVRGEAPRSCWRSMRVEEA